MAGLWTPDRGTPGGYPNGARARDYLKQQRQRERDRWRQIRDPHLDPIIERQTAIAFVDFATGNSATGTINTGTLNAATTPCVVVIVALLSTKVVNSVGQVSGGSTFTLRQAKTQGVIRVELWSSPASGLNNSAQSYDIVLSGAVAASAIALEYTGVVALGVTDLAGTTSTNPTITHATQDANNWMVAGFAIDDSVNPTALTGNLRGADVNGSIDVSGTDNTVASAGSLTNAVTHNSQVWAAAVLELRTASGGGAAFLAKPNTPIRQAVPRASSW